MSTCNDPRCPICYPKRQAEEAAAKQQMEEEKKDCVECWRFFQKKAEAIVAVDDPIARNRRINAAYAKLWLEDRRFQWAGLAAFASNQVGCGLLHAAEMIGKSNRQRDAYQRWSAGSSTLEKLSPYASPRMPMHDQASGEGAQMAHEMLAKGNTALFLDIGLCICSTKSSGLRDLNDAYRNEHCCAIRSYGPIESKVPFADRSLDIEEGFRAIDAGDVAAGVDALAKHEQLNILQPAMYNDPYFAALMRANQFAWALNIPSGSSREIQLAFAHKCTVTGANALIEIFSKQPLANLANRDERMAFVRRAASRFDALLRDPLQKTFVENSLFVIAHGNL
jgi:hypothetical protein